MVHFFDPIKAWSFIYINGIYIWIHKKRISIYQTICAVNSFYNSGRLKGITNINLEKDQTADVWISQLKF